VFARVKAWLESHIGHKNPLIAGGFVFKCSPAINLGHMNMVNG